jgi:hypothetical protein
MARQLRQQGCGKSPLAEQPQACKITEKKLHYVFSFFDK